MGVTPFFITIMENKYPSAQELFKEVFNTNLSHIDYDKAGLKTIEEAMIKFAKLHCKAQLSAILEKADLGNFDFSEDYMEAKDSIINAYDLNQIK